MAATLYDLESYAEKVKSCTDVPMPWVKRSLQDDNPTEIRKLRIASVKYGNVPPAPDPDQDECDVRLHSDRKPPSQEQLDQFCSDLKGIDSSACCISMLEDPTAEPSITSTDSNEPSARALELSVLSRIRSFFSTLDPGEYDCTQLYFHFIRHFNYSDSEVSIVQTLTVGQSINSDWHTLRNGRMTASVMHRIMSKLQSVARAPQSDTLPLLKSLTTKVDLSHVSAIQWGLKQESKARKQYVMVEKKKHKRLSAKESGLVVHRDNPLFSCSPDGIIECLCKDVHNARSRRWLIEIKCPANGKNMLPHEAAQKYCGVGENNVLSPTHKYYTQIQCQLGILDLKMCDLVVYTKRGLHVTPVEADETIFTRILTAANEFGANHLFPYLAGTM